jgi:RNA polymerase sigma-70 factor (ECF subfamily)
MDETRTDDDLIALVLAGDREAFAPLVARHYHDVYATAVRFVGTTDADDVAQEAFLRAYTRLATYLPSARFAAWVVTIGANYARDMLRRRHFTTIAPELLPAHLHPRLAGPEELVLAREAEDALAARVLALGSTCGPAVALVHCAGLTYGEASATLGLPLTTLKMRLFRGRGHLRAMLSA